MVHEILRLAFWLFVLFLAFSFFGISIQAVVTSPAGQANLLYFSELFSQLFMWATAWIRPLV